MEVMFSTYYILKNEYIQIRNLLTSEDYRKRYSEYKKIINQLDTKSEGTGVYLSKEHQDMFEKRREMGRNIPK